jgi:protein O-GlcNAc transferase
VNLKEVAFPAGISLAIFLVSPKVLPAQGQLFQQQLEDQITAKLEAGQTEAALSQARIAAAQYPKSSVLQQLLGACLFKMGNKEEARQAFQKAIDLDSSVPQNYYNLALLEMSDQRYQEAAGALETYLRLEPRNAEARLLLGRAFHNLNRTIPAIEHLGYALQSQGELKAALEEFKQEIRISPGFYDPYWLAGTIELGQGDTEEAAQLFRRGISVKPRAFQAHYGLGRTLLATEKFDEAESELRRAIKANPENVEAHYALARTYQRMGRQEDARREYQECSALNARRQKRSSGIAGRTP